MTSARRAALPSGCRIETAGAVEDSAKGAASIGKAMPLRLAATLALLMVQLQPFNRVAMVLLTGAPSGFVATPGCLALAGVIPVDQTEQDVAGGSPPSPSWQRRCTAPAPSR